MSRERLDGRMFGFSGPAVDYLAEEERHFLARPEPEFTLAIIGCGMIGREHFSVAQLLGRAKVIAVYDSNPRSVESFMNAVRKSGAELPRLCSSIADIVADQSIDAVLICTPNDTHLEVLRSVVESEKHLLLEKPMATTLADAAAVHRLTDGYPAVFQIGLQYRYKAIYAEALYEALERRSIGPVRLLSLTEHRIPFLDKVGQWNKFNRHSGGTLVEKCCHYFDLLNQLSQSKPRSVYANGAQSTNFLSFRFDNKEADILDHAAVNIEYENGCIANFSLCMFAPMFNEELVICGDHGRIRAEECEDFTAGPRLRTELEIARGHEGVSRKSQPHYPSSIEQSGHNGATYYEHIAFANRIAGRQVKAATVADGFWSVVVGVAAQQSIEQKAPIEITPWLAEQAIPAIES